MTDVRLLPVSGIGEVRPGDDLAATLRVGLAASGIALEDRDVVAVTQKIVSKAEGRVVPEGPGGRAGWVLAETRRLHWLGSSVSAQASRSANAGAPHVEDLFHVSVRESCSTP